MPESTPATSQAAACEHHWLLTSPEHGPYAAYGCQNCPATGKGYETIPDYRITTGEILAEARRALSACEQAAGGQAACSAARDLRSAFRALDSALSTGDDLPAAWHRPALPSRHALISAIRSVPPGHAMIMPAVEPVADAILAGLTACAEPGHDDSAGPVRRAETAEDGEDDGYTVVGVWMSDDPVPVGVIRGRHSVDGGDDEAFPEGLWATHVNADDTDDAEAAAIREMRDA